MRPEEQTAQVKEELYKLTLSFVRKYQPKYYYQYRGDIEDLASEFFCQFLTPKSRIKGKEETLLDKYDSTITSLPYLVKVSVIRMLIDRSRADSVKIKSIDHFVDEYGDLMIKTFGLSTESLTDDIDSLEFSSDFLHKIYSKLSLLDETTLNNISKQYYEVRNVLNASFRKVFDKLFPKEGILTLQAYTGTQFEYCKCQQITSKTVCILIGNKVVDFDRITGKSRNSTHKNMFLSDNALDIVLGYKVYKSGLSRVEMETL